MQFTRTRYGLLAVLLGIAALMLAGCGGDDGGLSMEDQARLAAAEEATAAAQAAAAAAAAEAMTAHEEAEEAKAEAAAAHEEAEAADAAAAAAQAEAAAAKAAADEAMMDDDMMATDDAVTLADLYEELGGMKIEEDLRMRVGTEGPLSTTVLKAAIMATAEAYHVDATSAIEYIDENYPTFEVLQRGAVETILEVLHMDNNHLSATAMTAELVLKGEKGDTGDAGTPAADDDTVADLQEQIAKLQPSAIVPPMPEGAKVLAAGNAALSSMADTYDNDMLSGMKKETGSKAAKGTYTAKAGTGFAGLNALQAGGDGANVFGSWLEYSHWGIVMGENNTMAAFSLGMPTGANPVPQDASKTTAKWTGVMTGAWMPTERHTAADTAKTADPELIPSTADAYQKFVTVRGVATIDVTFESGGTGYDASADLSITNLIQDNGARLGNFSPGEYKLEGGTLPTVAIGASNAVNNVGYNEVWEGMEITEGDFARNSITMTIPDAAATTAAAALLPNVQDKASSMNYLAGRFYDMDGDEVGGVFREDGRVSGMGTTMADDFIDNTTPADVGGLTTLSDTADAADITDLRGVLVGAIGAGRVTPITP